MLGVLFWERKASPVCPLRRPTDMNGNKQFFRKKLHNLYFLLSKMKIYLFLGLHKGSPICRRSLQPSNENIRHFRTLISELFVFMWVILALPDPVDWNQRGQMRILLHRFQAKTFDFAHGYHTSPRYLPKTEAMVLDQTQGKRFNKKNAGFWSPTFRRLKPDLDSLSGSETLERLEWRHRPQWRHR